MRKILDKLFENKSLALFLPLLTVAVVYLLFVLFTVTDAKTNMLLSIPFSCALWFFGVFFIFYIQVKNPICPEWFLNLFELLATVLFSLYSVFGIVSFVVSGFQNLSLGAFIGPVTYSAVSWAHSKRTK